jgi:hypothetical protein
VATTGSYTDLSNRPSIPAAQVNSDWNATSGLGQILNKPTIPTQYTDTLARAAITLTSNTPSGTTSTLTYANGVFTFTSAVSPTQPVNADWTSSSGLSQILNKPTLFSGNYTDLTNKPTLFSGAYSDLTGKPTLFSGAYADLSGKPTLFSGAYADLTGKPTIPAAQVNSDWNATTGVAQILNKPVLFSGAYADLFGKPTLFSGSYTDLTNKPSIPAAQVNSDWNAVSGLAQILNKPTLFSGSYNDLLNKPTIPAAQIQSDWNQANNASLDYIKNKPTIPNAYTLPTASTTVLGGVKVDGTTITINSGVISAASQGIDDFSSTVTTQSSTLTVAFDGASVIFWQPSANGNRTITLSNFTAGRRVKIFITPHRAQDTFTFTGVTASQCSNGSITYVLGGGGVAQNSMMIEIFSTTTAIGGVWIFGFGSQ